MRTLKDFLDSCDILSNGCWITNNTRAVVLYKNEVTYVIKALFDYFSMDYNGKIERLCGNFECVNPGHMWSPTKEQKFWSNIFVGCSDECWEWKSFSGTSYYPSTHFNGKNWKVHRLAYMLTYGEFDYFNNDENQIYICHHCDNPPCCNPNHLFLGTHQDNVDDRERKERNKLPRSRGEDHGQSKLTEEEVIKIRELYSSGNHSYYSLADIYDVSFGNIRNIIKRKTWSWLK